MGQTVHTSRPEPSPIIDLGKRRVASADLPQITDEELLRSNVLAYEDGYADGREYGPNGKFIPTFYSAEERIKYLCGFIAGCRVRKVRIATFGS